jgi:hypothetical protein
MLPKAHGSTDNKIRLPLLQLGGPLGNSSARQADSTAKFCAVAEDVDRLLFSHRHFCLYV